MVVSPRLQVAGMPGLVDAATEAMADRMTPPIRRNAAALLLELVQKTPRLAEEVPGPLYPKSTVTPQ